MPHTKLSVQEVADHLHISIEDVKELVKHREIPFQDINGRLTFTRGEIEAWASQRLLGYCKNTIADYHRRSTAKMYDLSRSSRIIADLLKPAYINAAMMSRTKSSIVRDMVALADSTGLLYDANDVRESILAREELCSTALSGGIAILHSQHHEPYTSEDSFIVLARTVQPIPYGAPDGKQTDLFFLVWCQDHKIHLHVLARICTLCSNTLILEELREANTAGEMYDVIVAQEEALVAGMS